MTRNYGLKFDDPSPEHYVFGASAIPYEELQPDGDWTSYLPQKEYQNLNNVEPYACVAFTLLNCLEILVKKQYGMEVNWSDRFLAAISETQVGGNSPQVVCEYLRKIGVVPQELWPFDSSINTFEKFYEPIPQSLIDLAREFHEDWDFKHEFVKQDLDEMLKALKCSPLMISVYAWVTDENGLYYNPGQTDIHATTLVKAEKGQYKRVFDTYGPDIKDLRWTDMPMIIKRFYIKKKEKPVKQNWLSDLFFQLVDFFDDIITKLLWR